jgi:urease accessory protein
LIAPHVPDRIRASKRASLVVRAGSWHAEDAVDRVVLDANERFRRRMVLTGEGGTRFILDLPRASALHDGDGLILDDGSIIGVVGCPEQLVEIAGKDAVTLARLAWHLGNRHVEVEILGSRLRIRRDHVLEGMLMELGAQIASIEAPFEPERGACDH